jgi:hypothetical protein
MKYGNVGGEIGCFMTTNRNISREANTRANMLAQQASGYAIKRGKFEVKSILTKHDVLVIQGHDDKSTDDYRLTDSDWRRMLIRCINEPNEV